MRKLLALVLVLVSAVALMPHLQQAFAMRSGFVDMPLAKPATYTLVAGDPDTANYLITCWARSQLLLPDNATASGDFFRCVNNSGTEVVLTWELSNGGGVIASLGTNTPQTVPATGVSSCERAVMKSVKIAGKNTVKRGTAIFRGYTASTATQFHADFYFAVPVTVSKDVLAASGGCL